MPDDREESLSYYPHVHIRERRRTGNDLNSDEQVERLVEQVSAERKRLRICEICNDSAGKVMPYSREATGVDWAHPECLQKRKKLGVQSFDYRADHNSTDNGKTVEAGKGAKMARFIVSPDGTIYDSKGTR